MLIAVKMTDTSREDHVYMAKLAEQAERYDDMVASMKEVRHILKVLKLIYGRINFCVHRMC